MAQKVNPISLRIQSGNNQFLSNWYSHSDYSALLSQDIKIRDYFDEIFKQLNSTKPRIFITQSTRNVTVHICSLSSTKSRTFRSRRFRIPYNLRKKTYTWKQIPELNNLSSKMGKGLLRKEELETDISFLKEALFYRSKDLNPGVKEKAFIRWKTICQNTRTEQSTPKGNNPSLDLSRSDTKTTPNPRFTTLSTVTDKNPPKLFVWRDKERPVERFSLNQSFLFSLWINQNKQNLLQSLKKVLLTSTLITNLPPGSSTLERKRDRLLSLSKIGLNHSKSLSSVSLVDKRRKGLPLPLSTIKEGLSKKRCLLLSSKTENSFLFNLLIAVLSANIITKRGDLLSFVYKISSLHRVSNWNNLMFLRYLDFLSREDLKDLRLETETREKNNNPTLVNQGSSLNRLTTDNKQVLETGGRSPYPNPSVKIGSLKDLSYQREVPVNRWKNFLQEILSRSLFCQADLKWYKLLNEGQSAIFLANELAYYLERKIDSRKLIYQICKETKRQRQVQGIRVSCSGRLGGRSKKAQRSKTICIRLGKTSLNLFSSYIDFAKTSVLTRFGLIGIKVWVCYKS